MTRRPFIARLALAVIFAASAVAVVPSHARAAVAARADEGTRSYWIDLTLPSKSNAAGMLILDESGEVLHGTLVLEGLHPVELDKVSRNGNQVTGEVETSRGRAKITVQLAGRSAQGSLVLLTK